METMKRRSNKSERGLVLPVIAAIAICLALLGLGVLQLAFGSRLMATRTMAGVSARAAADAGITRALYEMNVSFDSSLGWNSPLPPDIVDQPLNNSNARFSYRILPRTPDPYVYVHPVTGESIRYRVIESIGELGTQQKTVYATLGMRNLFDYGLIVTDIIRLRNYNLIDGYDSTRGLYTENDNTNSRGYVRIGTTSILNGAIWLGSGTEVTGDILVGIGGDVDEVITNPSGAAITGPWYNLPEPWYFQPIIIPEENYIPSESIGNRTPWDGTGSYRIPEVVTGETTYLQFDNIDVPNGKNLIFLGPVVIIVDRDLEIDNSANLYVGEPDDTMPNYNVPSSVTIYLNGDLLVRNNGNINNLSRIPHNFQLFGTGSPYQSWNIHNSGDYYGIYYGPNANIRTHAKADFYGSVSGHEFVLFNDGALHYDHDLSNMTQYDTGFGIDRLWEKSDFVTAGL